MNLPKRSAARSKQKKLVLFLFGFSLVSTLIVGFGSVCCFVIGSVCFFVYVYLISFSWFDLVSLCVGLSLFHRMYVVCLQFS